MWKMLLPMFVIPMLGVSWFLSLFGLGMTGRPENKMVREMAQTVVNAINAKDVDAMQALICSEVRGEDDDLPEKIQALFDLAGEEIGKINVEKPANKKQAPK